MFERFHIQAHRGNCSTKLENTFEAIESALALGADSVEIDIHLNHENKWIVFHDYYLPKDYLRSLNGASFSAPILLKSLSIADLKNIEINDNYSQRLQAKTSKFYKIETLEGVFEKIRHLERRLNKKVTLDLEIKSDPRTKDFALEPENTATQLQELLCKYHLEDSIMIRSFDPYVLIKVREKLPNAFISILLLKGMTDLSLIPAQIKAQAIAPESDALDIDFISKAQSKGYKVIPWTVNTPEQMQYFINNKVDGITTDYPKIALGLF